MTTDNFITFPLFDQFEELVCAFSIRKGGYSQGTFSSLNMGNTKFDDPLTVQKNRNLLYKALNIDSKDVVLPGQIHSATVRIISKPEAVPNTDALVSSEKGLYLGILTADCLPVFLYNQKQGTIAAIHAGWRGAVHNIVIKSVKSMLSQPDANPADLYCVIGPGLQHECFEVRSDVYDLIPDEFLNQHPDPNKRFLDLSGFIRYQMFSMKIPEQQIFASKDCTKCNSSDYYSHRRDGAKTGRMLGIIGMRY
jgi:YfiH family protein